MSKASQILRFLPNNAYQAAVLANAPSASNVYATMTDIPVVPPSINGIEIKDSVGTTIEPESHGLKFMGSVTLASAGGANSEVTVTIGSSIAAPATATSTGSAGTIAFDANYVYVCIATNTWKRAAIATW